MKVSIITTCYNREQTIGAAVESVLAQNYKDIEYIIIDGKSSDGSMDIISKYKSNISTIISEPDGGMYEAINKGIKLASGDIIGLVHSDDILYDSAVISKIVDYFEQSNADFVYGNGLFVNKKGKVVRNWISGSFKRWKIKNGWLPLHTTCYVKRSVFDKIGYYDESYKIAADTDFLLRCLQNESIKIEYLKEYVIVMRMGGLSTDKKKMRLMWSEDKSIYKKYNYNPTVSKVKKVLWKLPQFVSAFFKKF